MTLQDVGNAMRVEASNWATGAGYQFAWESGPAIDPHQSRSVEWSLNPENERRVHTKLTEHTGTAMARIVTSEGGAYDLLQVAATLKAAFTGNEYATAEVLESWLGEVTQKDGSFECEVYIPWRYCETTIPVGFVSYEANPDEARAFEVCRTRWNEMVTGSFTTYFNIDPPADATLPLILVRFKTFKPVSAEIGSHRVVGRLLAAIHYKAGDGYLDIGTTSKLIRDAFDGASIRGINFETPLVQHVGRTAIDSWQSNVRLPFSYEVS